MVRRIIWVLAFLATIQGAVAQVKISEMPAASSVADADLLSIVQGGSNKRATAGLLRQILASDITDSTTVGKAIVKVANPSAVRFLRVNADNSVTLLDASSFLAAIGGGASTWGSITGTLSSQTDLQTALNAKQPLDADLTTYAGITPSANIQSLLGAADYAATRAQLGLVIGTNVQAFDSDLSTYAGITPSSNVQSFLGAATYAAMRTQLGLVIGTDVLAPTGSGAALTGITFSQLTGSATDAQVPDNITIIGLSGTNTGDVTLAGSPTYITLAGQTITRNLINLATDTGTTADFSGKTSLSIPSGTAPSTTAAAQIAFDTNAWAASRGAIQAFDGTANTYVVAPVATDTPGNGQVPKWNTGGTITWEDDITASAGTGDFSSNTAISVDGEFLLFSGTLGKTGKRATGTGIARSASGVYSASELSGDATTSGSNAVTVSRINGVSLAGLATGLLKNTTATGIPSIAAAGTDYLAPSGSGAALTGITFSQLGGAATDAQIPDSITVTLATTATTANAGDSATAFFTTGQIERARGGTGADTSAYGVGLLGSDVSNATVDVDTLAEFSTALGITGTPSSTTFLRGDGTWQALAGGATWGAITGTLSAQTDLQTALDTKQPLDADLTSIAALMTTSFGRGLLDDADATAGRSSLGVVIGTNVQAFDSDLSIYAAIAPSANVQSILGAADYAAMRTQLGLVIGTNVQAFDSDLTTYAGITPSANVQSLLGAADYSAMRTQLGLVIGTDVQAFDSDLTALAGLTGTNDIYYRSAANTWTPVTIGSNLAFAGGILSASGGGSAALPMGYLSGLTLSNNVTDAVNDLDIAVGNARDATNAQDIALAAALTKRLDAAWAVGTNQGGLDTGTIADVSYHVFLIKRSDTGVVDVLFSASASAPTMPASYDFKRRIGSIMRVGGAIVLFSQRGNYFLRMTNSQDVNVTNLGTTAVLYALGVPTGIKVLTIATFTGKGGAVPNFLITSPDQTDAAADGTSSRSFFASNTGAWGSMSLPIRTNTSAQIRARASAASSSLVVLTTGWIDDRDIDATTGGIIGTGGIWGEITGTLSAQTDLQAALDAKQPLDADLTSLTGASGTNTLYYRSAADTWSAVTIGSNLTFTGGTLSATGGGSGTPGGSDTQVQFNDAGAFGGDGGFTYNKTTDTAALANLTTTTLAATTLEFEGATADAFETTIAVVDPTADRTFTLPNATGTAIISGDTFTGDVTATLASGSTALTVAAAIARDAEVAAAYQPLDSDLTSIAALTTTSFGRGLLDDTNAAAGRTSLELTTPSGWTTSDKLVTIIETSPGNFADMRLDVGSSTALFWLPTSTAANVGQSVYAKGTGTVALSTSDFNYAFHAGGASPTVTIRRAGVIYNLTAAGLTLIDDADAAAQRTTLSLVPGTDIQAFDADLSALAALTGTNTIYYRSAADTWTPVTIGSNLTFSAGTLAATGTSALPQGYLTGLTLSNSVGDATNDIDIAIGEARDAADTTDMERTAIITKRLDAAWTVGDNQGGLDTGSIANTTYHVWLIKRTDGTAVDVLFSTSATAPTMPANYTFKRRIGSIIRTAGAIVSFTQFGNTFLRSTPVLDVNVSTLGTSAALYTLASIPTGIKVNAMTSVFVSPSVSVLLTSPDQADTAVSAGLFTIVGSDSTLATIRTNTSAQIRARSNTASSTINIMTYGWIDDRDINATTGGIAYTKTGVFRTLPVNAGAMIKRTTNGAAAGTVELATNDIMIDSYDFDSATEEGVGFWVTMPREWNAGSLKVVFQWTAASGSGNVKWDIAARAFAHDDALDQALGTEQTAGAQTLTATNDMQIALGTPALTPSGTPAAGQPVYFQITRDTATDTLGADAKLLGVEIQYQESSTEPASL